MKITVDSHGPNTQILFVPMWAADIAQSAVPLAKREVVITRKNAMGVGLTDTGMGISLEEAATALKRMAVPFLLKYADHKPGSMPAKVGMYHEGRYVAIAPEVESESTHQGKRRLSLAKQATANKIFEQDQTLYQRFHGHKPR